MGYYVQFQRYSHFLHVSGDDQRSLILARSWSHPTFDFPPECLMWFCKACITALPGLKKLLVRVTACENEQTEIKQRITQLEQKEKATNIKSIDFDKRLTTLELQDLNKDIPPSIEGNLSDVVDNVLSERTDQEKRKLNLICINMKESNKDLSSEMREEDSDNLRYILMEQLGIDPNIEISDLVRLGKKILLGLNPTKSCGPDECHPRMLKETADILSGPIHQLFTKSLQSETLPKQWKEAYVTCIFKKGDKSSPGNYRPVSLTSVLCKSLEKIVRKAIMKHLNKNNLSSDCQYGFR